VRPLFRKKGPEKMEGRRRARNVKKKKKGGKLKKEGKPENYRRRVSCQNLQQSMGNQKTRSLVKIEREGKRHSSEENHLKTSKQSNKTTGRMKKGREGNRAARYPV